MRRRVEFLLFAAGYGANHFSALLVVYRRELGFSASALGLLFGAYALGLVPGLILAGRASDRRGRRALVLPASALAIAASCLLALGRHDFTLLLLGRLGFGLAMGAIMSPGSVWLQELSSDDRGPRRATLSLSAGFGLGPLVTGLLAEFVRAPTLLPYVVHGAVMAGALLAVRSVPETAPGVSAVRTKSLGRREIVLLLELLPVAPWAFGLASITIAVLPGILRGHVSRPVVYSASVIATTLLAGVLVQPLTSRLGRRADLLALAIGCAGTLLAAETARAGSPMLAFPVALLLGSGYGLLMTTGLREIAERVDKRERGVVVGIYYVLTYVGFALPFAHASIADQLGDAATLLGTSAAIAGCFAVRAAVAARRADAGSAEC